MTRGITGDGNGRGLEEQLYWFSDDGFEKVDVGMPQAFGPSWSPSGDRVAFLGAPTQGRSGVARADSVFNLYTMKPDGTSIQAIVEGFRYVATTDWSPDGQYIVLHATFGTIFREQGLWLIEADTGQRFLITSGKFSGPRWSPDSTRLVAIQSSGELPNREEKLVIVDLRSSTDAGVIPTESK